MDREANEDSLKEGTDFVVGEGNSNSYELEAFISFYFLAIYLRDILMKRFKLDISF